MNIDKANKILNAHSVFYNREKDSDIKIAVAGSDMSLTACIGILIPALNMHRIEHSLLSLSLILFFSALTIHFLISYGKIKKVRDYLIENNIQNLEEK